MIPEIKPTQPLGPFERIVEQATINAREELKKIPSQPYHTIEDEDGIDWCLNCSNAKGIEVQEPEIDLEKEIDRKYLEDAEKHLAMCNEAWILEYRAKMFRNVWGNGRSPKK